MTIAAIVVFSIFLIGAFMGLIVPVIPDVPLVIVGVLLAAWMTSFEALTVTPIIIVIVLAVAAHVLDYLAGLVGAKRFGAGRAGMIGSLVGSLVGLFFFPPFGFLVGALAGAVVGELLVKRPADEALKAGVGVVIGTLGGILAKVSILIAIAIVVFPRLL